MHVLQVPLGSSCAFDGDCGSALDCLDFRILHVPQCSAVQLQRMSAKYSLDSMPVKIYEAVSGECQSLTPSSRASTTTYRS